MDTKETLLDIYSDGGEWEDMEPVIDELIAKNATLEARLAEAEAIIKPFADNAIVFEDKGDNQEAWGSPNMDVTVGDFRRAAAFLKGGDAV